MAQTTTPIEVKAAVLPSTLAAALRYAVAVGGPLLIARGYLPEGSLEGVSTIVISAGTILYGLWKTHQRKALLVEAAREAPNDKFVVK